MRGRATLKDRRRTGRPAVGKRNDGVISGIDLPLARPNDVVALTAKRLGSLYRNAGIEEDLGDPVFRSRLSMRSCATTRRAYTRQP